MPPRHVYWTIIVDDQPTAFRAHDAEELEPTLNRLKEKHPSAVMRWFERGKLWESRDAARAQGFGQGERRWEGPRPDRPQSHARDTVREGRGHGKEEPVRDRNWRPGGEHRDPRQKYRDAKKAKWTRFKEKVRKRDENRRDRGAPEVDPQQFTPPHGDPLRDHIDEGTRHKPWRPTGDRGQRTARPRTGGDRRSEWSSKDQRDRGRFRPESRDRRPKANWRSKPAGDRPPRPRDDWQPKPKGDWQPKPKGDWRARPQGEGRAKPKGDQRAKPPGDWRAKPKGDWRAKSQGGRRSPNPPHGKRKRRDDE